MSVVSSESRTSIQVGPLLRVKHTYTFHTGETYRVKFETPDMDLDVAADRLARVSDVEVNMRNNEIEYLVQGVITNAESGDSPAVLGITPVHQEADDDFTRTRRFRRQLVRWAMRHRDIKVVRRIFYDVWFWAKFTQGYTVEQIATYLNVSTGIVATIDTRMQAIHDNLAFVDADSDFETD